MIGQAVTYAFAVFGVLSVASWAHWLAAGLLDRAEQGRMADEFRRNHEALNRRHHAR